MPILYFRVKFTENTINQAFSERSLSVIGTVTERATKSSLGPSAH